MNMSVSKLWKMAKDREAWDATVHGVPKSQKQLSTWTTTRMFELLKLKKKNSWLEIGPLLGAAMSSLPGPLEASSLAYSRSLLLRAPPSRCPGAQKTSADAFPSSMCVHRGRNNSSLCFCPPLWTLSGLLGLPHWSFCSFTPEFFLSITRLTKAHHENTRLHLLFKI